MNVDFASQRHFQLPHTRPSSFFPSDSHTYPVPFSSFATLPAMSSHGFVGQGLPQALRSSDPTAHQIRIRHLPADMTNEQLQLMLLFSQELVRVQIQSKERSQDSRRTAIVEFATPAGARQAKDMLHGKSLRQNEPELVVEMMPRSPTSSGRYPTENSVSKHTNGSTPVTSPGPLPRQSGRFVEAFQSLDKITPPSSNGRFSMNGMNGHSTTSDFMHTLFSPHSPFNNVTNSGNNLGKTLIHDTAEDDETRELLKDPVAYAENGPPPRRSTVPAIPITQMTHLSLNTNGDGTTPISPYPPSTMTPVSAHGNTMSPTTMNGASYSLNYHSYPRPNFPPINPADQNPPCNTLYVGNLPADTSEEELKALFQKARGYKRLCFRTKQNGPMCFVEFEDVSHATRALHELYGKVLHNSVKGGIRLSFSKNPLGVRSNQPTGPPANCSMASMNGMMATPGNGFSVTSRPPPGLATPPGLNRHDYNGHNQSAPTANTPSGYLVSNGHGWSNQMYNGHHQNPGSPSPSNGSNSPYPPNNYMGR